jgi:hypothetical protein
MSRRRVRTPGPGLAQGFQDGKIPEYLDLLVAEGARDQTEAEFVGALRHGLNEVFGGDGMHCAAIGETIGNTGYRVLMKDRESRDVWAYLSFQDVIDLGEQHGTKGMFDRALGLLVSKVRAALAERNGEPTNLVEATVREHAKEAAAKQFGTPWKEKNDGNA